MAPSMGLWFLDSVISLFFLKIKVILFVHVSGHFAHLSIFSKVSKDAFAGFASSFCVLGLFMYLLRAELFLILSHGLQISLDCI